MYLFILESIGTSELILIGLVALMFFGPRKLPDLARTLGKAMNEFRRSTTEFKTTWEKEVASEVEQIRSEVNKIKNDVNFTVHSESPNNQLNSIEKNTIGVRNQIVAPEIKEVSQVNFPGPVATENFPATEKTASGAGLTDKQNWL